MSLREVVEVGDRRASLAALRDYLAQQLDECDSKRDVAALANRLTVVLEQLANLPTERAGDPVDEIASRRAARRSSAS